MQDDDQLRRARLKQHRNEEMDQLARVRAEAEADASDEIEEPRRRLHGKLGLRFG